MSKFIVGLTGGVGSGKTTVANLFAEHGITLVDADIVARKVVDIGTNGLQQIVERFGADILTCDGHLNRNQLRELIFSTPAEREWLNQLLHPMIRSEMLRQVADAISDYVIMVVPLLFENGLDKLVNRTLVVDVPVEEQIKRVCRRDNSSEEIIRNIINSQMSRNDKRLHADDIINNNDTFSHLKQEVDKLHTIYQSLAKKHYELSTSP